MAEAIVGPVQNLQLQDGSSDSGVEEDKSPRKIDTPKKSPEDKVTTRSTFSVYLFF